MSVTELISKAIEKDPVPIVGILVGCISALLIVAVVSLTRAWRGVRVYEAEASLKQQMLERGMSAEEIERVMKAGSTHRQDR